MAPLVLTSVLDLLAPSRCLACRRRATMPWCAACATEVRRLPSGCARCAGPAGRGHPCWPPDAPVDGTIAVYDYRGPVASGVVTAKLGGARSGWHPLAVSLASRVAQDPPDVDVVTWVTTPGVRARARGVDHVEFLARAVSQGNEMPLARLLDVTVEADGHDRFAARTVLPGSNVLLVDDVVTTGATAVRAATALRTAGAGRIVLAVLARAGSHPLTGTQEHARRGNASGSVI